MMSPVTLQELAQLTGADLFGDPSLLISGVAGLEDAEKEQVSFLGNPLYLPLLETSKAGAIFITKDAPKKEGVSYLIHENPSLAFQKALELFTNDWKSGFTGIHPTAVIHETSQIDSSVSIGPYVVIDAHCVIGEKTRIDAHVSIGSGVYIGKECHFFPHATIREGTKIGDRVILQPGCVIGSCGFGYNTDAKGTHKKLAQVGIVVLEDDVEIGANTTIDRARFAKTIIGKGTKIDNLVQIAHNVKVGNHTIIVSQCGIAGSTEIGNHVILAGKVGVNGHIKITDQVMVSACSAISKSITEPGQYGGVPVVPIKEYRKQTVFIRQLEKFFTLLQELKKRISDLENR